MAVNLRQNGYRFGINELAESTHGWLAAQNTALERAPSDASTFLCRILIQEVGGSQSLNLAPQWQYSKNGGAFASITTTSSSIKTVTPSSWSDAANCTSRLGGSGTFVTNNAGCTVDGLAGGSTNDVAASGRTETEVGLQLVPADIVSGDVIVLRIASMTSYMFWPVIQVSDNLVYSTNMVTFDGTNDSCEQLTAIGGGVTDNGKATFVLTIRMASSATTQHILSGANGTVSSDIRWAVYRTLDNRIGIYGGPSATVDSLDVTTPPLSTGVLYSVCGSVDLSNTSLRHIYVNDVDQTLTINTWTAASSVEWTTTRQTVGRRASTGDGILAADVGDVWFDPGRYVDFPVEANRRLFFNANNIPVDLGAGGELPFGTAPAFFLSGKTTMFNYNRGLAGGFTVVGALTDGTQFTKTSLAAPVLPAAMTSMLCS
jgi:hypothetical protein